jgi:hypothetical protein
MMRFGAIPVLMVLVVGVTAQEHPGTSASPRTVWDGVYHRAGAARRCVTIHFARDVIVTI